MLFFVNKFDLKKLSNNLSTVETHETGHLTFRKSCVCDNDGLFTYATVQDQIRMARRYSRTHFHDGSLALIKR